MAAPQNKRLQHLRESEEVGRMRRRPTWFTDITHELNMNVNESKLAALDEHKLLVASNLNSWLSSRDLQGRWNMSLEKLTTIPSIVWAFTEETVALLLQDNLLSSIPVNISELSNLRRLELSGNELRHLPNSIAQLSLLEDLFLDRNEFTAIPPPIMKLGSLVWLDLQDNYITEIPLDLTKMTTLRILDLSDNRIPLIPPEIGELSALSTLSMSGNSLSLPLPDRLFTITTLRNLQLQSMNLSQLSSSLGKLVNLEKLNLSHNVLEELPKQFSNLTNLRVLQLSYNKLKELPNSLGWVARLTHLAIDGPENVLSNVPEDFRGSCLDIQIALRQNMRLLDKHCTFFREPDNHLNIVTKTATVDGELREVIVGCSPEKLIERMTLPGELDVSLVAAVLLTYSCFMDAKRFLDLLFMRFNIATEDESETDETVLRDNKIIRLRVFNLIKKWLENHFEEFDDTKLQHHLNAFMNLISKSNPASEQAVIQISALQRRLKEESLSPPVLAFADPPPKPIVPPDLSCKNLLVDIHPKELARQLTLLEQQMMEAIKTRECLEQGWGKRSRNHLSPNIMKFIAHFNHVQKAVTTIIVRVADRRRRIETIHRFIEMAEELIALNNFSGASEVYSGLQATSVHRLKQTWELLSGKQKESWERLRQLWASDGNSRNYRDAVKSCNSPKILHLGTFLKDLTFLLDGNPDFLKQNRDLINIQKYTMIAQTILMLLNARKKPYCLQQVPFIQDLILNADTLSEEESYHESLLCEPKPGDKVSARARELRLIREKEMLERNSSRAEMLTPEREQRVEEVHRTLTSALEAMGIEVDGVHRKDGILFLRHDGEWTRFYFLLMYPALYYYQEKGEMTPVGVINLAGTVIRGIGAKECYIFIFHSQRRTYAIRGEIEAETRSWLQCLQAVVETTRGQRNR